jgi:hypothetical protein
MTTIPTITVDNDEGQALAARFHNQPRTVLGRVVNSGHGPHFGTLDGVSPMSGDYAQMYLHGRLEGLLGYDIPFLLSGDIADVAEQDVLVVDPADSEHTIAAVLVKFERHGFPVSVKHYGLIVLPEELDAVRQGAV